MTDATSHTAMLQRHLDLDGARVVDVGCGAGELVRWLRSRGADVVGVECGEVMMRLACEADPEHTDRYLDGVGQDLPLPDEDRDVVVMSFSLHHVPRDEMVTALREAHRVLRPGGMLYVAEPVASGPMQEVVKIVDDETVVRAQAQEALLRAPEVGFELVEDTGYTVENVVDSSDQLATRIVGVDPMRAAAMDEHRSDFQAAFERNATRRDDTYVFEQPTKLKIFRKPSAP